jgi:predicted ATPase/class 3 adenylate cyclase
MSLNLQQGSMNPRPLHSIALMFTDIEGSTRLWEKHPAEMKSAIVRHDRIVDGLIVRHGGKVVDHAGDGVFAAFESGTPLSCALEIQQRLQAEDWGVLGELRVRIAVHAGERTASAEDFRGTLANRTARIMATGWGGQILVTPEVIEAFPLPEGAEVKDLGEHLLKDLSETRLIWELAHPSLKLRSFPALRSLSSSPNNLPPQTDAFIGREEDLAEICRLLEDPGCRLITLVGPGGMGKSRLAVESASRLLQTFRNGVFFVPLAPLDSPGLVISAIANAMGFNFYGREDPEAQLLRFLDKRQVLLVLDNFEHLLEAAGLVTALLAGAPGLKVLATSRERLRNRGERAYPLEGMRYPDEAVADVERYSAVGLFADRARHLDPDFQVSDCDKAHVIDICRLVDGMPLGIELAAAWTRLLGCEEIAAEIRSSLDFLATSQRDVPERHRSLRAVFDYSWKLMGEDERAAFRRLAAFKNGFGRDAAQKVAGAQLHHLAALMDKSLLRRDASGAYAIHELLRQFGEEKLLEDPAEHARIRTAHCDFYADFVRGRRHELRGRNVKQAGEEIQAALENVRLGWNWALDQGRLAPLDRSIAEMIIFFEIRSDLRGGHAFFEKAARRVAELEPASGGEPAARHRVRSMALAAQGLFLTYLARYEEAISALRQGLELARRHGLEEETGYCLFVLAAAEQGLGHYETATQHLEDSIEELGGLEDLYRLTHSRIALGQLCAWLGRTDRAWELYETSIRTCDEMGDVWARMICQMFLGDLLLEQGDLARAKQLLEESLAFLRKLEDWRWTASCLINLGRVAVESRDDEQARRLYEEGAAIARRMGDRRRETISLTALGGIERRQGAPEKARERLAEALRIGKQSRSIPEILDALLELVRCLDPELDADMQARLLGVVLHHPASKQRTLVEAGNLGRRIRPDLRPGQLDQAVDDVLSGRGSRVLAQHAQPNVM